MTPEFQQKVFDAQQRFYQLPHAQRSSFLEQLRSSDTDVAAALEARLQATPAEPDPDKPETVDYVSQADSVEHHTTDYHPPATADLPQHIGRYAIDSKLGEGGMGVVYRGRDPDLKRFLAVKVIQEGRQHDADLCRRFLDEAQIMGQLQHPGVAPIHEIGTLEDGRPLFSMKQVQGKTLAELLHRGHRRPACDTSATGEPPVTTTTDLPHFIGIFEHICQTLAYAHSQGILHRDLKPANIMVGAFGEVQVMDWGLAKHIGTTAPETAIQQSKPEAPAKDLQHEGTQTGVAMGTPAYMAPEQARGEITELDERCDVFGLGAVLCVLLTGKPPFWSADGSAVFAMARRGDLTDAYGRLEACGAEAELIELCKHCLAAKREDRPRDAGEVAQRVDEHQKAVQARLQQAQIDAAEANVRAEAEHKQRQLAEGKALAERKRRRATVVMACVAFVLFAVLGISGWAAWQQATLEPERYKAGIKSIYEFVKEYRFEDAKNRNTQLQDGLNFWVPQSTREQLDQAEKDIVLTHTLDQVRLKQATLVDGKLPSPKKSAEEYKDEFQELRLSINDEVSAAAVVKQLQDRHPVVRTHVIAAVDAWAALLKEEESPQRWLLKVARELDQDDPVRRQLRQQSVWNNPSAVAKIIKQLDLKSASPQLIVALADQLGSRRENKAQAYQFLARAQALHPRDFWLLFALGVACSHQKEHDLAIGCYRAALAVRPKVAAVIGNWGNALYEKKDVEGALAKYQKVTQLHPKNALAYYNWGAALSYKKDLDGAIAKYQKATQLDPISADAYNNWGAALSYKKDLDSAIAKYQKAIQLDPKLAKAYTNWGLALAKKKDLDGAIAKYQKAIQLDPRLVNAYTSWGNALAKKKDLDGAIAKYQKATQLDPKDAKAYYSWGNALAKKKDLEGAIAKYQKATQLDPKRAEAYTNWGNALADKKDLDGAIGKFQTATQLDPKDAKAYCNWGVALANKKDLNGAIAKYEKAIQLDPKLANAYYNWGIALSKRADLDGAIGKYEKATQLDPKLALAYKNWGNVLARKKDFDGAIAKYEKAIQLDPKRAKVYYNWGVALAKKKDLDGAIGKYRKATQLDPKHANAYTNWGNILADNKDLDGAIAKYKKAVAVQPKLPEPHGGLGDALLATGQFVQAVDAFETLQKLVPAKHPYWGLAQQRIQRCRALIALEKKLPDVISGKLAVTPQEQRNLAVLCQHYKKRYHDAARLYAQLFTKHPKYGEDLRYQDRYNAACCALLAAVGKGFHAKQINAKEQSQLRQQALTWLNADLQAYHKLLKKNRLSALTIKDLMQHWQSDPDLTSVRDKDAIAKLPQPEQKPWHQLWSDVKSLQKSIGAAYTETKLQGTLTNAKREQAHPRKMTAGTTYVIDMQSKQFDTLLRLTDAKRKQLAENDDITPGKVLNSRLIFTPSASGVYRLVADSYGQKGRGPYEIVIREFKAER